MSRNDTVGCAGRGTDVLRILVVDDSEADRHEYRRILKKHEPDWEIVEAASGNEGLELLRDGLFDCVILDYRLPDMEGSTFVAQLRGEADGAVPPVPVAVLTGHDDDEIARRVLHEGAEDFLVKGTLTGRGFTRVIENAVEKHAIRWELEHKRAAVELRTWQLERTQEQLRAKVAELATATRAKDQFVAVMSHEMRTPLNAVLGYAELLEVGVHGELPPAARGYVERIRLGGRHLLELINDVLDMSRVEADEVDLNFGAVDPVAVAEEVTHLLEGEAAQKGVRLELQPPAVPLAKVHADLRRMRQILTNLVANAIKFTDDGAVTISLAQVDDAVAVQVRDTGVGIPDAQLPLVFDRFFQVDGSFTRQRGGIGLGLAIAQRLARLMGGDIEAQSVVGEGSTFTLVLPVTDKAAAPAEPAVLDPRIGVDAAPEPAPAAVRVLAFSEKEEALRALQAHVSPAVELIWTASADDVPGLAIENHVELVMLDISASNGMGWAAAHALQDAQGLASTAVLLLPGMPATMAKDPSVSIDLGWVSLVPKPFTEKQLTHAVSRAADSNGHPPAPLQVGDTPEVLVVDDDPASRHVAHRFLRRAGLRVREAKDGESALVAMRYKRPEVVVLDLMMPVLDGFGVLAAMRADASLASVPVVVLSAKSLTSAERAFLGRSAVRVLQKGEHRLADVAALVLRAASGVR